MTTILEYKIRLEQEYKELVKELESIGIRNPGVPEDWIATPAKADTLEADINVSSDRNEDWAEKRALIAPLETRYNNVTRAIKKIEEEVYGRCEVCNKKIETTRLDANAAARTCKKHVEQERSLSK